MPKRLLAAATLLVGSVGLAPFALDASVEAAPLPGTRYIDRIFPETVTVANVHYATAPALVTGEPEQLLLDQYAPLGDTDIERPAIVFIHGGGFKAGGSENWSVQAAEYAQRGYVTFSIEYRLDPGNRCGDIRDGKITDPGEYITEMARCRAAMLAAQHDSQAAIRWIRANASALGVDPTRVAAIGGSAGAVTAVNLAYRSDDVGDVGDHRDQDSRVQASIAASGCSFDPESIGPGDAPVFILEAELDKPVPFECVLATVAAAQADGLVIDTMYYYVESTHARALYVKYQTDVDRRWTAFLYEHLNLSNRIAPGTQTVIRGLANRSAVVSIVSVDNAAPGYVQVLPCGTTPGGSSNLNTDAPAQIRAGLAIVNFDGAGEACLFNMSATHLVADLQGYFTGGAIDDVSDVRLVDTRAGGGGRLAGGQQTQLTGRPNATAVVSLVADQTVGAGYLQVLPCGSTPGGSSNLNADRAGQIVANLAFVRFDEAGHVCVYNQTSTHLVVDLQAYLSPGTFDDVPDVRALDTRGAAAPAAGSQTPVPGRADSTAVVSLIATETSAAGYVQALSCGAAPGTSSNVNADAAGQTVANLAVVRFADDGRVCLYNLTATHLVADVQGYLATAAFDDVADVRLLDSRVTG